MVLVELSDRDFDNGGNLVNPQLSGKVVVAITQSWCGHCQRLKPVLSQLGQQINVGVVEGTTNEALMSRLKSWKWGADIKGYPHVMSFYNGKAFSVYQGDRTLADLLEYNNDIGNPNLKK